MVRNGTLKKFIAVSSSAFVLSAVLAACSGGSDTNEPSPTARVATPTITPFVPVPTAAIPTPTPQVIPTPFLIPTPGPTPTPTPIPTPTPSVPTPTPTGIDMRRSGFTTALIAVGYSPGTAAEINSDPYVIKIPEDALRVPATFTLLIADPFSFRSKVSQNEEPLYAFALRVENDSAPNRTLIENFDKQLELTITSGNIGQGARFYRVAPDGSVTQDSTGLTLQQGKLTHPLSVTTVGWLVTNARR